jgi:hypothetical protein
MANMLWNEEFFLCFAIIILGDNKYKSMLEVKFWKVSMNKVKCQNDKWQG